VRLFELRAGIVVQEWSIPDFRDYCNARIQARAFTHVCTVNPEIVHRCTIDPRFKAIVNTAEVRTIDGAGLAVAATLGTGTIFRRLTGVQILGALVREARRWNWSIQIIGASESVRVRVEDRLRAEGIKVVTGASPAVSNDGQTPFAPRAAADINFVALGAPKQEVLISRIRWNPQSAGIWVGVGGAVDYYSGEVSKPPRIVRGLGLEWLYRLTTNPRTRLARQRIALPSFFQSEILPGLLAFTLRRSR